MADYTPPPWSQLVAGKAWTDEKAAAAFENAIAIAEGARDAPRNKGVSLGGVYLGRQTSTGTAGVGFVGLGRAKTIRLQGSTADVISVIPLRLRFTADGGATWGAWQILTGFFPSSAAGLMFEIMADLETGAVSALGLATSGANLSPNGSYTFTVPANCDGFQLSTSQGPATVNFHTFVLGGRA